MSWTGSACGDGTDVANDERNHDPTVSPTVSLELHDITPVAETAAAGTATIPHGLPDDAVLMFCEPSTNDLGEIATIDPVYRVRYAANSCEPQFDGEGLVIARDGQGVDQAIMAEYRTDREATFLYPDAIVWTPAKGVLNGTPTIMTAALLDTAFLVESQATGDVYAILSTTTDGAEVLGSLTTRILERPLAMFIAGEPLRTSNGQLHAPIVKSRITDQIAVTGLSRPDAERLVELIDSGAVR